MKDSYYLHLDWLSFVIRFGDLYPKNLISDEMGFSFDRLMSCDYLDFQIFDEAKDLIIKFRVCSKSLSDPRFVNYVLELIPEVRRSWLHEISKAAYEILIYHQSQR